MSTIQEALKTLKENREKNSSIKEKIKDFYIKTFNDDLGEEINPDITFESFYDAMKNGEDVYELLGVQDSIIRERVFSELAKILKVDYDEIYNLWLSEDLKEKSLTEDSDSKDIHTFEIKDDWFDTIDNFAYEVDQYFKKNLEGVFYFKFDIKEFRNKIPNTSDKQLDNIAWEYYNDLVDWFERVHDARYSMTLKPEKYYSTQRTAFDYLYEVIRRDPDYIYGLADKNKEVLISVADFDEALEIAEKDTRIEFIIRARIEDFGNLDLIADAVDGDWGNGKIVWEREKDLTEDAEDKAPEEKEYFLTIELHSGHSEFLDDNTYRLAIELLDNLLKKYYSIRVVKSWFKDFFIGDERELRKFADEFRNSVDDYFWLISEPKELTDDIRKRLGIITRSDIPEELMSETYSKDELKDFIGKTYNQQKVINIYRRKKYSDQRLFAHTKCTKCGREKKVYLSNLLKNPKKYGSCICSDTNIDSKIDYATKLYSNSKLLRNNTSGYTGVSYVRSYRGKPYGKWRAYIEVDGKRSYLGDFNTKKEAIVARKEAGEKGIKWYKENRNKITREIRKRSKKYEKSKYRDTDKKTAVIKKRDQR